MRAEQRKPVLMILDLLHRDLPSPDRVALFTAGAELALVNVGVTISAFHAHVTEYRLGVTRRASHLFMQAAQRETSLVVVKLWNTADRFPAAEGVAILARNVERSVWAARVGIGLRLVADCKDRQQRPHDCRN